MAKGIDEKNCTPVARALKVPGEHLPTSRHDTVRPQSISFGWSVEILTVDEFATKMKVGETTVWKWIGNNTLLMGRHYFQNEKIIRFPWGPELINKLMEDCVFGQPEADTPRQEKNIPNFRPPKKDQPSTVTNKRSDIPKPTTRTSTRRRYDKSPINPDLLKRR